MNINAIILASGKGKRVTTTKKKQYMKLSGIPIFCHSLIKFQKCSKINNIYLTIPKHDNIIVNKYIHKYLKSTNKIKILEGSKTRQESVLNALKNIEKKESIVIIHDSARPFITKKLIYKTIDGVKKTGACIPAININDSLKKKNNYDFMKKINRNNILCIQTPQTFCYKQIFKSHTKLRKKNLIFTDDSSLVEKMGIKLNIIQGINYNIKVTTKKDLFIANAITRFLKN